MDVAVLDAQIRKEKGGRRMRVLRASGRIPGIIYGLGKDNLRLSVAQKEFTKHVLTHHKLFELHLDNGKKEEAFLQDLQWDNLTDKINHVDFIRIELNKQIHTTVEIVCVGHAKGLAKNGVFDQPLSHLMVECLPASLPEEIRVVINDMDVGDSIHVGDLPLPSGVKAMVPPDQLVCHVKARGQAADEGEEPAEEPDAEPEVIGKKTEEPKE
ncbi:MAG: 50S ribosomal protein L25 [Planctomycetota bacterium]